MTGSHMTASTRAAEMIRLLRGQYPQADCTLDYGQSWQLLVAAILSAQCTDARVNLITPALFARYPTLPLLAGAEPAELENLIRSCGLYRTKARSILAAGRQLLERHGGLVPDNLADLTALTGVGRKIANLILGDAFGVPAVVVDTHCARISGLLGLTAQTDPHKIELDLMRALPRRDWIAWGHLMVEHGRRICIARKPRCGQCPLSGLCDYALSRANPDSPS